MSAYVDLLSLPSGHPMRQAPLVSINAAYCFPGQRTWRPVKPSWRIAQSRFDDLGDAWTKTSAWRGESP